MRDFFDFGEHPGNLFVIATLLPLLSVVILLLWNGIRSYLRKFYDPEEQNSIAAVFHALDGEGKTRVGAYIATGAIFLSFCLVLAGSIMFLTEYHELHSSHEQPEERQQINPKEEEEHHKLAEHFHDRWNGSVRWAWLTVTQTGNRQGALKLNDDSRATTLSVGYHIDHLAIVMFLMVTFIATLIHLFSIGYMSEELHPVEDHEVHTEHGHLHRRGRFTRFFMFLSLFCFSMLNLILANNLFQVFVSWELVGICSFLLIGFYYERTSASNAANKAFITNRVGDAGFIIGVLILWTFVGTLNFEELEQRIRAPVIDSHHEQVTGELAGHIVRAEPVALPEETVQQSEKEKPLKVRILAQDETVGLDTQALIMPRHLHGKDLVTPGREADVSKNAEAGQYGYMPYWMLVLAGLGIFLGCVGKSAQFPLHVWLPDAMEGPTPVSALIHAATMVAAGVYLVGRAYPLFTPEALLVIAYVGAITLFLAATIAVVMTDIKKVLAYSTVSQLGYMMLALGLGGWVAGLFHLVTHAFFKALLFLGSGSVIFGCHHVQEMPRMGGLFPKMKITALTMFVAVLAISGIPLFSGWYSKDAIIAQGFGYGYVHPEHFLLTLLPLVTAGITTFYMFRMWFLTFTGEPRDEHVYEHAHESPWVMTVPLILLAVFTVIVAWPDFMFQRDAIWHAEKSWLEQQIHHAQPHSVLSDFGRVPDGHDQPLYGTPVPEASNVRHHAHLLHDIGGLVALATVLIGFAFASSIYWFRVLDPAEAKEQFAALYSFLAKKWHFDELYSVLLVRPALVVAGWCKAFDTYVIDGIIHLTSYVTVWLSWFDGEFDRRVIDGIANKISDVCYGIGARLRNVQTGYLRSYVLFLVLAAVGIWILIALMTGALTAAP